MTLETQQKAKSTTTASGWLKVARNHNLKREFYPTLNAGKHLTVLLRDQKLCKSGHHYTSRVEDAGAMKCRSFKWPGSF